MLAHAVLYWLGPYLTTRRKWLAPYLVVQGGLTFTLILLSQSGILAPGLFLVLAGQAVGILENVWLSTAVVAGYLALAAFTYGLVWGWAAVLSYLAMVIPLAFLSRPTSPCLFARRKPASAYRLCCAS